MGKAVPAPRSQGQPGTSVRVTLHIWVLSPAPWPRAGLSVPGLRVKLLSAADLSRSRNERLLFSLDGSQNYSRNDNI